MLKRPNQVKLFPLVWRRGTVMEGKRVHYSPTSPNPLQGEIFRPPKALLWLEDNVDEHALAPRTHNLVLVGCSSMIGLYFRRSRFVHLSRLMFSRFVVF